MGGRDWLRRLARRWLAARTFRAAAGYPNRLALGGERAMHVGLVRIVDALGRRQRGDRAAHGAALHVEQLVPDDLLARGDYRRSGGYTRRRDDGPVGAHAGDPGRRGTRIAILPTVG